MGLQNFVSTLLAAENSVLILNETLTSETAARSALGRFGNSVEVELEDFETA